MLQFADLHLDQVHRTCVRGRRSLNLTAREFDLLLALLRRQGEVVSCASLAKEVWGGNLNADAPLIRVTIQRLRGKLDDPFGIKLLHTVRGAGYVLGDNPWGSNWFLGTPSTPAS